MERRRNPHAVRSALAACIVFCVLLTAAPVAYAGVGDEISNENELKTAINDAASGDTLPPLNADITVTSGISITGKRIAIDLAGHTLTIQAGSENEALSVTNGNFTFTNAGATGSVNLSGGTFGLWVGTGGGATVSTVTGTGSGNTAVYASDGAQVVILRDVTANDQARGVFATGADTSVSVYEDVVTDGMGVTVRGGASVAVTGAVDANKTALSVTGAGSIAHVGGNVLADTDESAIGTYVTDGGEIDIDGSVTGVSFGVYASAGGTKVNVDGTITVTGVTGTGAGAFNGADVTAHSNVFGGKYGVYGKGANSKVTAYQNVSAPNTDGIGAYVEDDGEAFVLGNAAGYFCGAFANNGLVIITGSCTGTDLSSGFGAYAIGGSGKIAVLGTLVGENYIKVGSTNKASGDRTNPTTRLGFRTYSDGAGNTVWLKDNLLTVTATPTELPASGGAVTITVSGNELPDGISVTAFLENTATSVTAPTDGNDTTQTATLTFPANTDTSADKAYTVKGQIETSGWSARTAAVTVEKATAVSPTVVTGAVTDITTSSATFSGNVSSDGGSSVTARGFICGSTPNPTIEAADYLIQLNAGTGTGTFSRTTTHLPSANTTYHVRAFAINDAGVAYGDDVAFTTLSVGGDIGGGGISSASYEAVVTANGVQIATLPVTVSAGEKIASVSLSASSAESYLENGGAVITMPSISDVSTYTLKLPASSLSGADSNGALTVSTSIGSMTIPENMFSSLTGADNKTAAIAIGQGDTANLTDSEKTAIGSRPVVQIFLTLDGTQTAWSNSTAPVTMTIPYTPTAAELANPESIVIWYLDGSGTPVCIPNGQYNTATGAVTFKTTHFSRYAVGYNAVSFEDVADAAWYSDAVSFLAARGVTSGATESTYSPDAALTRGQFLVMLMRAYGIAAEENPTDNFADAGSTYYTGYLAAAKRLGITNGIGNNLFMPDKAITRQEMFTLLYNALKSIDGLPTGSSGKELPDFSDADSIAAWAKDAMSLLVKTGTITGSDGKLSPTSTTTRAEMAQVLYNLLSK